MLGAIRVAWIAMGFLAAGSAAADTALLIGNGRYDGAQRIRGAQSITTAAGVLEAAGFDVITGIDMDATEIRESLSDILNSGEEDRILIALSGHFAHGADGEAWFLGSDGARSNRATVGEDGVALSTVYAIAAEAPGRSIILLGTEDRDISLGAGLTRGLPSPLPEPPQGVAVVLGNPRTMTQIAGQLLPRPGTSLPDALHRVSNVRVDGFVSDLVPFVDEEPGQPEVAASPSADERDAEDDLWAAVTELNTEGAYISYLRQYPTGRYASDARAAFEALRDPLRIASEEETALALNRTDRRGIQADLTVLGFDTNGIDGIFGNGTRSAIRAWQASEGLDETGYLNRAMLRRLSDAANQRREQVAAEEAIRSAERDRLDRAYWTATGQGQDEAGLRAYLNRYPQGIFADVASARLDDIEAAGARATAAAEEEAWDFATRQDSVPSYRGYLAAYPQGNYTREAQNRIAELQGQPIPFPDNNIAELEAAEAALNLPGITRMLIERRLDGSGYNPGTPDGRFDDRTRAAIRAFQEDNDLTPTGYLDQRTLSEFLSDGIRVIIR